MAKQAAAVNVTKFPEVNHEQLAEFLDLHYQFADGKLGRRKNLCVVGEMGTAKSAFVRSWAEGKFDVVFDFRGATQTPEDMTGNPRITEREVKDASGKVIYMDLATDWARPGWIPVDKSKKMLIIFEEINRAAKDVQQAIFQALTENRIHTHEFPAFTQIVALINPPDSKYQVDKLDIAMHDRFFNVVLKPNVKHFLEYLHSTDADQRIIQFMTVHPELLCVVNEEPPSATLRGWEDLSDIMKSGISDDAIAMHAAARVGGEIAATLRSYIDYKHERPVGARELLKDYDKVRAKLHAQENDQNGVTTQDLIALLTAKPGKLDAKSFDNLKKYLIDKKGALPKKGDVEYEEDKDGVQIDNRPSVCPGDCKYDLVNRIHDSQQAQLSDVDELVEYISTVMSKSGKKFQ